jgi:hypothetical protein
METTKPTFRKMPTALAIIVFGAAILMIPAIINGSPFVFWDTNHYLAFGRLIDSPDPGAAIVTLQNDPALLSSPPSAEARRILLEKAASYLGARSIAYSLFLSRTIDIATMWGTAFAQCAFVTACLFAALRSVMRSAPRLPGFLLLSAGLAAVTPLPIVATLLIPDLFTAPMVLLIAALFAGWPGLKRHQIALLAGVIGVCTLMHTSNAPIAFLTLLLGNVVLLLARRQLLQPLIGSALVAASLFLALVISVALTNHAEKSLGARPLQPPFLSARVIDDGPGKKYLQNHCSMSPYVLCQFADRILSGKRGDKGDAMMFDSIKDNGGVYLVEDLSIRKRLRDENLGFVRDSIVADIRGQIFASTWNFVKLMLAFRVDHYWGHSQLTHTAETWRSEVGWLGGTELTRLLPNIDKCNQRPNEPCGALHLSSLRIPHYVSAILSFAFLAWHFFAKSGKRLRPSQWAAHDVFILICLGGIVANAFVCGILAGPYDRYQLRVIWLLPALAGAAILFFGQWNLSAASNQSTFASERPVARR